MIDILKTELKDFESFLKDYLNQRFQNTQPFESGLQRLKESIEYTLFAECKRFRPALSIAVCQVLNIDYKKVFPLAGAVEMIHTASLIHDDLPCMDNDTKRRGKPANHIVFKEDTALLAGDALWMEAFYLLSFFNQKIEMIQCLAQASSVAGMVGGQALDLAAEELLSPDSSFQDTQRMEYLQKMHQMKTGALIQSSLEGPLYLQSEVSPQTKKAILEFSYYLGHAFQLADDLEDKRSGERSSILSVLSQKSALKKLDEWTKKSLTSLDNVQAPVLKQLALFNQTRICS